MSFSCENPLKWITAAERREEGGEAREGEQRRQGQTRTVKEWGWREGLASRDLGKINSVLGFKGGGRQ